MYSQKKYQHFFHMRFNGGQLYIFIYFLNNNLISIHLKIMNAAYFMDYQTTYICKVYIYYYLV